MDARQQRTRERLFAAVLDLAARTPPEEISVTELARAAGVHRSTLYEHAPSPVALLQEALLAELDEQRARLVGVGPDDLDRVVGEVTEGVLDHVLRHAAVYRRGLGEDSGAASLHAMLGGHVRASSRLVQEQAGASIDVAVPGVAAELVADQASRFIAEGTVGMVAGWLQEPDPDVASFMRVYERLLPAWWPHRGPAGRG